MNEATVVSFPVPSLDARIERINEQWSKIGVDYVAGIIKVGEELIAAQAQYGASLRTMAKKLPFSWSTACKLIAIAQSDVFHEKHPIELPADWNTLHQLTRVPEDIVHAAIKDGRINPKMTRKDAMALIPATAKEPRGVLGKVLELYKQHPHGMTTVAAKAALPKENPQTVADAVNSLFTAGRLVDSGKTKLTGKAIKRPSKVYTFNPNPQPLKPKKTAKPLTQGKADQRIVDLQAQNEKLKAQVEELKAQLKLAGKAKPTVDLNFDELYERAKILSAGVPELDRMAHVSTYARALGLSIHNWLNLAIPLKTITKQKGKGR